MDFKRANPPDPPGEGAGSIFSQERGAADLKSRDVLRENARRRAPLAAVLFVAAVARLARLDLMQFGTDQARAAHLAVAMAHGTLARVGIPSSLGTLNPPGFEWLLALPALASSHALFLTGFVAVLGVLAVALTGLLAERLAGPRAGLFAAGALACAPWAVHYSRSIWAQDTLPCLTAAATLALTAALREGRRGALALSCVLVALSVQVHLSALAFALAWGCALAAGFQRRLLPGLAVGLALAAASFVPFGAWEAAHRWHDLCVHGTAATGTGASLVWTASLLTAHGFAPYLLGDAAGRLAPIPSLGATAAAVLVVAALLVGFARWMQQTWRAQGRATRAADVLPLTWIVLPVVALMAGRVPVFPHYLIVSLPAQAFFVGVGFDLLAERWTRLAIGLGVLVLAAHLAYFQAFNNVLASSPIRPSGDYRATWQQIRGGVHAMVARDGASAIRVLRSRWWAWYILRYEEGVDPGPPPPR